MNSFAFKILSVIAILLVLSLLAFAIDGPPGQEPAVESDSIDSEALNVENVDGDVVRFTDPDTGNTCYVLDGGANPSISCVNGSGKV